MLTDELQNAIDTVCGACPYVSECCTDDKLYELAGCPDAAEKYCKHCMVRNMYDLYSAMDKMGGQLPYTAQEWQAIINY